MRNLFSIHLGINGNMWGLSLVEYNNSREKVLTVLLVRKTSWTLLWTHVSFHKKKGGSPQVYGFNYIDYGNIVGHIVELISTLITMGKILWNTLFDIMCPHCMAIIFLLE